MGRVVWGALFGAACLLAAFLIFIVFERYSDLSPEDGKALLIKGFILAGGILVIGLYPLFKMRQHGRAKEPRVAPSAAAQLLASIEDDEDENEETR